MSDEKIPVEQYARFCAIAAGVMNDAKCRRIDRIDDFGEALLMLLSDVYGFSAVLEVGREMAQGLWSDPEEFANDHIGPKHQSGLLLVIMSNIKRFSLEEGCDLLAKQSVNFMASLRRESGLGPEEFRDLIAAQVAQVEKEMKDETVH